MSGLPPGWEWDYDGRRWLYKHRHTGHVQYHFPNEGDEYPSYVHSKAPKARLAPEERLESQQQVRRHGSSAATDWGSRMSARAGPVSDVWDEGVEEPRGRPESMVVLGLGTDFNLDEGNEAEGVRRGSEPVIGKNGLPSVSNGEPSAPMTKAVKGTRGPALLDTKDLPKLPSESLGHIARSRDTSDTSPEPTELAGSTVATPVQRKPLKLSGENVWRPTEQRTSEAESKNKGEGGTNVWRPNLSPEEERKLSLEKDPVSRPEKSSPPKRKEVAVVQAEQDPGATPSPLASHPAKTGEQHHSAEISMQETFQEKHYDMTRFPSVLMPARGRYSAQSGRSARVPNTQQATQPYGDTYTTTRKYSDGSPPRDSQAQQPTPLASIENSPLLSSASSTTVSSLHTTPSASPSLQNKKIQPFTETQYAAPYNSASYSSASISSSSYSSSDVSPMASRSGSLSSGAPVTTPSPLESLRRGSSSVSIAQSLQGAVTFTPSPDSHTPLSSGGIWRPSGLRHSISGPVPAAPQAETPWTVASPPMTAGVPYSSGKPPVEAGSYFPQQSASGSDSLKQPVPPTQSEPARRLLRSQSIPETAIAVPSAYVLGRIEEAEEKDQLVKQAGPHPSKQNLRSDAEGPKVVPPPVAPQTQLQIQPKTQPQARYQSSGRHNSQPLIIRHQQLQTEDQGYFPHPKGLPMHNREESLLQSSSPWQGQLNSLDQTSIKGRTPHQRSVSYAGQLPPRSSMQQAQHVPGHDPWADPVSQNLPQPFPILAETPESVSKDKDKKWSKWFKGGAPRHFRQQSAPSTPGSMVISPPMVLQNEPPPGWNDSSHPAWSPDHVVASTPSGGAQQPDKIASRPSVPRAHRSFSQPESSPYTQTAPPPRPIRPRAETSVPDSKGLGSSPLGQDHVQTKSKQDQGLKPSPRRQPTVRQHSALRSHPPIMNPARTGSG